MKDDRKVPNPFRMLGEDFDLDESRLEDFYTRPLEEATSLHEGVLVMISKIIEMTRELSRCIAGPSEPQMDICEALGGEIHGHEKVLTKNLVNAKLAPDLLRGVIRFPFRLERIGDMLESILNCCRIQHREGIRFSPRAYKELDELFTVMLSMFYSLRDGFVSPDQALLEHVIYTARELLEKLQDFRTDHWERLVQGLCVPEASSLYLDVLDSIRSVDEYVEKMCHTLLELGRVAAAASQDVQGPDDLPSG